MKWTVLSFLADLPPHSETLHEIGLSGKTLGNPFSSAQTLSIDQRDRGLIVDTGTASLSISDSGKVLDTVITVVGCNPGLITQRQSGWVVPSGSQETCGSNQEVCRG